MSDIILHSNDFQHYSYHHRKWHCLVHQNSMGLKRFLPMLENKSMLTIISDKTGNERIFKYDVSFDQEWIYHENGLGNNLIKNYPTFQEIDKNYKSCICYMNSNENPCIEVFFFVR